ncbi:hypothetical protein ACEPPN_005030 [Leptodophora sp. 'Broadleaf-Isolate-01']
MVRFHWAFLIGPKTEKGVNVPGVRFHVKNTPTNGWVYEEKSVGDVRSTNTLLARIIIAKVEDEKRLINLLQNLPIVNGDPNWRYRSWVAQALTEIARDGKCVGTSELDWRKIEAFAREYVANKTAAGRYGHAEDMLKPKPTYDLLERKEVVLELRYLIRCIVNVLNIASELSPLSIARSFYF